MLLTSVRPVALAPRLVLACALAASPAAAQIVIAGYAFDAAAAPDVATPLPGSQMSFASVANGCVNQPTLPALTLQQSAAAVLTDAGVSEWISHKLRVQLDFTDNCVVNGPGTDLVVFEIGGAEPFALQVFSDAICEYSNSISFSTYATGFSMAPCGTTQQINAAAIDLDAFGILPGASVRRVLLDNLGAPTGTTGGDIAGVFAFHSSVPLDASPSCLLGFQQGIDGYAGALDTAIAADMPGTNYSSNAFAYVDGSPEHSLLLRFDGLVGAGASQVPPGATIAKATLTLSTGSGAADGSTGTHAVHRLLSPFTASTTWSSGFGGDGVEANGVEASVAAVTTIPATGANATITLDVTSAVQAWAHGAPNHGFVLLTASSDALGVQLSEAAIATLRPALSVQAYGKLGFAEAVHGFAPVIKAAGPLACALHSEEALGAPDYVPGVVACCQTVLSTVTLGSGGVLELEFLSVSIAGSGSPEPDLWIYERGPDVEDTFIDLSADGSNWVPAGKVFGATSAVDLDALGFGPLDLFRYIRLTDDPMEGQTSDCSAGADIDAVAALAPSPWLNLGFALAGTHGLPKLAAAGALAPNGAVQFAISNALPGGAATLIIGTSQINAPFKGGTLVPSLTILVTGLPLGPAGAITLPAAWPAGVPAGVPLFLQAWFADAGGPKGFAATNAIKTVTQ